MKTTMTAGLLLLASIATAAPVTLDASDITGQWKFAAMGVKIPVRWASHQTFPAATMATGVTSNYSLVIAISSGQGLSIVMPGPDDCLRWVPQRQIGKNRLGGVLKSQDKDCIRDTGVLVPFKAWRKRP